MDTKWKKPLILLMGIALIFLLRKILGRIALLLLVSATIAYLLHPLMHFFQQKMHLSEGVSAAMAFVSAAIALGVFLLFGVPALIRQLSVLGQAAPGVMASYMDVVAGLMERLSRMGLPDEAMSAIHVQAGNLLTSGAKFLVDKLITVVNGISSLGYLIFAPVLAFYMLKDKGKLFALLTRLIPSRMRRNVLRVGRSVRDAVGAYVSGQMMVSMITGALTALGLLLIGLPSWFALGMTMMLCNLIPYFGPWLGAIPIVLFSVSEGFGMVAGGVIVVLLAQQIEGLVVSPRVIGDAASLHPGLVVLTLIAGGWLAGLPGMFYSIPAVVSLRAAVRALRDARLQC